MSESHKYLISGSAFKSFPVETFFGLLFLSEKEALEIPKCHPFGGNWGYPLTKHLMEEESYPLPQFLDIIYLSIYEKKFYSLEANLPVDFMYSLWNNVDGYMRSVVNKYVIVGMAPYGGVAVWLYDEKKSYIVLWEHARQVNVEMKDFLPLSTFTNVHDYCESLIKKELEVECFVAEDLFLRNRFDKYMQQFTYRYQPLFEKWDDGEEVKWQKYKEGDKQISEFEYIEESLYDGTHDKLHDEGLLKYHEAGKPKKLAIKWHIKKSEYTAYFWFEDERICTIFERFYGAHSETKTDFIIHIDAEQKKYELALFRQGLKEPQIIPEDAYQLLVFKNKFEHYRSDNYNQERGAWIW